MKRTALLLWIGIAMLVMTRPGNAQNGPLTPPQPVAKCGFNIGFPGTYALTANLDCSGTLASAITINASNVVLHLASYSITSSDCDPSSKNSIYGIWVMGGFNGVHIDGGAVKGFNDGIVLSSNESSVENVTVQNSCAFGIAVQGKENQLVRNIITNNKSDGIGVGPAEGTVISSNYIGDNYRIGIDLSSNSTKVVGNAIVKNGIVDHEQGGIVIFGGSNNFVSKNILFGNFEGIVVESLGNTVDDNLVSQDQHLGIWLTENGSHSLIQANSVYGNGEMDMQDDRIVCLSNTWRGDVFLSDLVHGVSDGGPGTGCLR